jgi:class 3 adenylate cyclase
MVKIIA